MVDEAQLELSAQRSMQGLRELLAIVDVEATPMLAILSLAQHEFASALAICENDFVQARLRFADLFKVEINHFGSRISSRDVSTAVLKRQGMAAALVADFLGDIPADCYIWVMRVDWPEASALFNPRNKAALFTSPDHWLLSTLLPEFSELAPDAPRAGVESPRFLRLLSAKDARPNLVGDALRHLEVGAGAPRDALRELLSAARGLETLVLRESALLESGIFDNLALPMLRRLDLLDAAALTESGWERVHQWPSVRRLKIDRFGVMPGSFAVLHSIGDTAFWTALEHLDLRLSARQSTLDPSIWANVWAHKRFELTFMRLRFVDQAMLAAVWQGRFDVLAELDISRNDLRDGAVEALRDAVLPALRALDIRRNSIADSSLRKFAMQHGFPRLMRVAIDVSSDEIESYHDWNGALVGSGPVPLSADAVQAEYLAPVGLGIFPGFDDSM